MRVEDLSHVFKASPALGGGEEARSLGASLLNKFELALCWDARSLLVPPLLPEREPRAPQVGLPAVGLERLVRDYPAVSPTRVAVGAEVSRVAGHPPPRRAPRDPLLHARGAFGSRDRLSATHT